MTTEPVPAPKRKGNPVLVGCLVVAAVVLIGGGLAAYWFVGRPALNAINAGRDLVKIQQLEGRVSDRSTFSAPADGVLTATQLDRYLAVNRQLRSDLESRLALLEERYDEVSSSEVSFAGLRQAANAWADLLRLIVDAKETQVAALNANGFSLSEYDWVRTQALSAAGFSLVQVDLDAVINQDGDATVQRRSESVPQVNRDLVAPYAEELESALPLAVFGL